MKKNSPFQYLSHSKLKNAAIVAAQASLLLCGVAHAQSAAAASDTGEIVVTAERRETLLRKTPIAITALDTKDLEAKSIVSLAEVQNYSPGVTIFNGRGSSSNAAFVFIRGIGQYDLNPSTDPGVGIYVDDVYLGRVQGGIFDLDDVAGVEVLRGPQGTLYGKNTIGGAIVVKSKLPDDEFHAFADLSYGNYNYLNAAGSVSGPVAKNLSLGVAFSTARNDGYLPNAFDGKRYNDINNKSLRFTARATPTEALEMLLSLDYTQDRSNIKQARLVEVTPTPLYDFVSLFYGSLEPYRLRAGQNPFSGASFDTGNDPALKGDTYNNIFGASLRNTLDLDGVKLKSITSYRQTKGRSKFDDDAAPVPIINELDEIDQSQFTQEFQLSGDTERLAWLAGLYYYHEDVLFPTQAVEVPLITPPSFSFVRNPDFSTDSYSAFANATYKITDALRVTAGLRYTYEKKSIETSVRDLFPPFGVTFGPASAKDDYSDVSPKFGLDYQVTPQTFVYASAAKGFKSGGFNGRAGVSAALQSFSPETAWTYEAGVKGRWFDGRVSADVAAYYTDYKNIQLTVTTGNGTQLIQLIQNAGKGHIQGLELQGTLEPIDGLTISGNAAYTDAQYDEYFDQALGDLSYLKFQNVPEWTWTLGARYESQLSDDISGALSADYSYRSKTYTDVYNAESIAQKGFGLLNARASLFLDGGKLEVAAYGKNLTNEYYKTAGFSLLDSFGYALAWYGDPRTYGLELKYRY